jgi:hypothetical protein
VTKKNPSRAKIRGLGRDRRAGGCAASRELRITCVAFGIRNHPRERIAERHGAYRPVLPAFGAVEEPEIYRTATVTVIRYPSLANSLH